MVIRHTAYMLVSTALRALAALVTLAILARLWSQSAFGLFTYAFTVTSLVIVLVDYGFGLQVVRDAARTPSKLSRIVSEALQAKLALTLLVLVGLGLILLIRPGSSEMVVTIALQLVAALAASFGLVFNLGLRGIGRFDLEAGAVAAGSLALILFTTLVAKAGGGPIAASAALLLARVMYLVMSVVSFGRVAPLGGLIAGRVVEWFRHAVRGIPFGLHMILGTAYFQVDTLLIQRLLGLEAVGLYQAAFRLLVGGLLITDAISNVYLQRIAVLSADRSAVLAESRRLVRRFSSIGLVGAACFAGAAGVLARAVYGPRYVAAERIISLLGVVLYLRSFGAAYGIVLTVSDQQIVRTIVAAVAVVLSILLNILLIPQFGLEGVVIASIATHVVVNAAYIVAVWLAFRISAIDMRTSAQLLASFAMLFVVWTGAATISVAAIVIVLALLGLLDRRTTNYQSTITGGV